MVTSGLWKISLVTMWKLGSRGDTLEVGRAHSWLNKCPAYPTVQLRGAPSRLHTGVTWGASQTCFPGLTLQRFWVNYLKVGSGTPGGPDAHPHWEEQHDAEKREWRWEGKSTPIKTELLSLSASFSEFFFYLLGSLSLSSLCFYLCFSWKSLYFINYSIPQSVSSYQTAYLLHDSVNFHFLRAADINRVSKGEQTT